MRSLEPLRHRMHKTLRRQPRLRDDDDVTRLRCRGDEQRRVAGHHIEKPRDAKRAGRLIEQPSRLTGRCLLLIGEACTVQPLPRPGFQAEFTNEGKACKFGQRLLFEEDAMEGKPQKLREFRRRADDRPFGCPVMQVHDDPLAMRSG